MIVDDFKYLGRMFSDLTTFITMTREEYKGYTFKENNEKLIEAFLSDQLNTITAELKKFVKSITKEAQFPPFDTAIPLLYIAHTNLQGLVISSNSFLQELLELDPIAYDLAEGEIQQYLKLHADGEFEEKEYRVFRAKTEQQTKTSLGFQGEILIPLLRNVIHVFKEQLVDFEHFYKPILKGLDGDVVEGKEAAIKISQAFLGITHDKDLYTFIDITKKGTLTDDKAYTKLTKTDMSPEVLAILFYYLREKGLVTNTNISQIARLISLLTGVSHNTIRPALGLVMHKDPTNSYLIDGNTSSAYANQVKKLLRNIIELIDKDINHNLQKL
ncbi:hypothetical protein [Pontibacter burrus]|uniref:Uncharacterized protein n=1 Tax=Pontibacter burrus TaxID=2704466 RepID=A0A6B3LXU8_9BACT|nr:hypothetical protein [Pontibacter burrus]NEM99755.1 hypothetical protein [Pontibacter burrus]